MSSVNCHTTPLPTNKPGRTLESKVNRKLTYDDSDVEESRTNISKGTMADKNKFANPTKSDEKDDGFMSPAQHENDMKHTTSTQHEDVGNFATRASQEDVGNFATLAFQEDADMLETPPPHRHELSFVSSARQGFASKGAPLGARDDDAEFSSPAKALNDMCDAEDNDANGYQAPRSFKPNFGRQVDIPYYTEDVGNTPAMCRQQKRVYFTTDDREQARVRSSLMRQRGLRRQRQSTCTRTKTPLAALPCLEDADGGLSFNTKHAGHTPAKLAGIKYDENATEDEQDANDSACFKLNAGHTPAKLAYTETDTDEDEDATDDEDTTEDEQDADDAAAYPACLTLNAGNTPATRPAKARRRRAAE